MARFTLRQLEYLVACVEHRSVAAAAERLNVSQPTISVAIAKMEARLGVQLLLRHHAQGVTPTRSAENILPSARSLLAHASDLERQAMQAGTGVAGELKLGSLVTIAPAILPRLVRGLTGTYPELRLTLQEATQEDTLAALFEGRLDLALLYDLSLPEGLRAVPLTGLPPYVALPEGHGLCAQDEIALEALVDEPLILLDLPTSREYFLGLFDKAGLSPRIAHTSPSVELVRGMVGQGLGYSILATRPESDVTYDGRRIVVRALKDGGPPTRIMLVSLASLRQTRLMGCVEDVAVAVFSQDPPPRIRSGAGRAGSKG